ncbi:MAG: hypothetical protein C0523_00495 [Cytophaga sp.]|nr:hypothetical protein [Cytophaga sp.]
MSEIISFKLSLNKTNPCIWRRVLVPASISFFDFHHILQISMGWKNSHLFEFQVGDYKIGYIHPQEAFDDVADAGEVTLDLLLKEGMTLAYLYDFGDYWMHGGIHGFYRHLEIIKDPRHEEYKEVKRGLGRGYDPEKLDLDKVNKELPKFKKYRKRWQ